MAKQRPVTLDSAVKAISLMEVWHEELVICFKSTRKSEIDSCHGFHWFASDMIFRKMFNSKKECAFFIVFQIQFFIY